jgi:hypothetical protein
VAIYRRRYSIVEATQWWTNGDHPEDNCPMLRKGAELIRGEGRVVRYFRRPDIEGTRFCARCGIQMHDHGWLDTGGVGRIVCPGDWVVTFPDGQRFALKTAVFQSTFEPNT